MDNTTASSPLLDLPDDLLLRVLVGVPWERANFANDGVDSSEYPWSRYEAVAPETFRDCNGPLAAFGSVLLG